MMTESNLWIGVPVVFTLLDNVANILSLGFYSEGFSFNSTAFQEQLFFTNGFSLLSSGLEFALLGKLRRFNFIKLHFSIFPTHALLCGHFHDLKTTAIAHF
jgi:hypothetical protein